jgi:hypothetical protein
VKDGKMRACSKCSTVDRQVRYCSRYVYVQTVEVCVTLTSGAFRECQVKAWPVHKKTCGRPYGTADVL